ncbi:MAG: Cleavage polyadenylation factor subunit clp1 [Bogoriella megaspora]|nr:MAG: Cleavage polyadenylation factor subunit clp1 [Bogoriella megaspora]
MSIPGLSIPGLSSTPSSTPLSIAQPSTTEPLPPRTHTLPPESEYRFEAPLSPSLPPFTIKLLTGSAELFGTELAPQKLYTFPPGAKGAIFTWLGASLEATGDAESEFVAEETSMVEAANVHFALENLRPQVGTKGRGGSLQNGEGPRVLVLGAKDSGKTSLARILTGYAVRMGRQPVVVNLDQGEGGVSVPGGLTATVMASVGDVESVGGWGGSAITGPSATQLKSPLVYFYGMESLGEASGVGREPLGSRRGIWKALVTRLALAVTSRMEEDLEVKAAGFVIDTPGILGDKKAYELVEHLVGEFSINVILVVGSERLFSDMKRKFAPQVSVGSANGTVDEAVKVVKLAKSGGCVDRDETYMKAIRAQQIRSYFFGEKALTLSPLTVMVGYDEVTILRYSEASTTSTSSAYLPGQDPDSDTEPSTPTAFASSRPIFTSVPPSLALSNAVLALPHCSASTPQSEILTSAIMGFAYVADIDEQRKGIRFLVPAPMRLEGRVMIWGGWPEGVVDLLG